MGLFGEVFNRSMIYRAFFFKVNSVLEHRTLDELKKQNLGLHETWIDLSKNSAEKQNLTSEEYYQKYAPHYPEYSKIVGVTYGVVSFDEKDGKLKKQLKRIVSVHEQIVLEQFFDVLYNLSSEGQESTPRELKTLCGFNIIYNDIPLLIKRFFILRDGFKEKREIPFILKNVLDLKPWENHAIIDLASVWNLKGRNIYSIDLISNFLGFKKDEKIMSQDELSEKYWSLVDENEGDNAVKLIAKQGTLFLNIIIAAFNKLRTF